ncbi:MAG: rhomboid family intramembrane serine protease [Chitinispirillaceae bacterium]|nr:rhomboid family intramembrane serine protease [Chitinispirillaceae bacterium]
MYFSIMFPLRDENPTLQRSVITPLLVFVNVAVWIIVQGMGTAPALMQSVLNLGLIPGELLGRIPEGTRIPVGSTMAYVIDGSPHWFSLLSHMFLHGSWFHLIGNLWFLWVFGDNVEDAMGRFRFLAFYLLCGSAAAAAQIIADPSSAVPMVGASGAISGVMGAYAVLYPKSRVHVVVFLGFFITRAVLPAFLMLAYWILIQFVGTIPRVSSTGGIAFWAHIGGFAAGVVLIFMFRDSRRVRKHHALMRRRGLP